MRKAELLKIIDDGQERTFRITQMPATRAERWANRMAFLFGNSFEQIMALSEKAGQEENENDETSILPDVMRLILSVDYEKAEPLYNELIECCEYLPDGANINGAGIPCSQETIDAQIVDPVNLYKLRAAALKLNFRFFMGALQRQDLIKNTITFTKNAPT